MATELARRRLNLLVDELMVQLRERQGVAHGTDYVGDVEQWRKAARIAGCRLGIPTRTGVLRDWQLSGVKRDTTGIRNQWGSLWIRHRKDGSRLPSASQYSKPRPG
jgi:hypothetical protein